MSKGCEEGMRRFVFRELKKMRLERWARGRAMEALYRSQRGVWVFVSFWWQNFEAGEQQIGWMDGLTFFMERQ